MACMPQPGAHQQALADDSGHITYDVDTAKSAQEHLLGTHVSRGHPHHHRSNVLCPTMHSRNFTGSQQRSDQTLHTIAILMKQMERDSLADQVIEVVVKKVQEKLRLP